MAMKVGYHGDSNGDAVLSGRVWVSLDEDYARGYALRNPRLGVRGAGRMMKVDLSDLRILDLRHLDFWPEDEELAKELEDAGVEVEDGYVGEGEMHQRVPELIDAIRAAGYDAVAIREWTDCIGEAETVCIFEFSPERIVEEYQVSVEEEIA